MDPRASGISLIGQAVRGESERESDPDWDEAKVLNASQCVSTLMLVVQPSGETVLFNGTVDSRVVATSAHVVPSGTVDGPL